MISRYLVIALALGAAAYRASEGAWVEATGLAGLGAGLIALRFAPERPAMRSVAFFSFGVAALAIVIVLVRQYR